MEIEDCEFVRDMFNNPEMENLVVGWSFPLSKYSQIKWYESNHNNQNFRFIVETKEDGGDWYSHFIGYRLEKQNGSTWNQTCKSRF